MNASAQSQPKDILDFWVEVCRNVPGIDPKANYDVWYFGDSEALARELAMLVLDGPKRATTGLLAQFNENSPLPRVGGLSLVTDFGGKPLMLLRTTSVEIVPFREVTKEFAAAEGEGDGSFEYWRDAHVRYFSRTASNYGIEFGPDTPVVCECFELLYPVKGASYTAQK